jgi:hypothetical protein
MILGMQLVFPAFFLNTIADQWGDFVSPPTVPRLSSRTITVENPGRRGK